MLVFTCLIYLHGETAFYSTPCQESIRVALCLWFRVKLANVPIFQLAVLARLAQSVIGAHQKMKKKKVEPVEERAKVIFESTLEMFVATKRGIRLCPAILQTRSCRRLLSCSCCLVICLCRTSCHRMKPADVPLAPSMAEVFLLADDPSGLRVYWADVTEDRGSEVKARYWCQYNLDRRNISQPNSKKLENLLVRFRPSWIT